MSTASIAGDLVGQTLTSGVYKSTGPIVLGGTLTLDAQGDPNAAFIFQIADTLITASASNKRQPDQRRPGLQRLLAGRQLSHARHHLNVQGDVDMALTSITVATGTVVEGMWPRSQRPGLARQQHLHHTELPNHHDDHHHDCDDRYDGTDSDDGPDAGGPAAEVHWLNGPDPRNVEFPDTRRAPARG